MTTFTYTTLTISCANCVHTIQTDERAIKSLLAEINYPLEGLITL